MSLKYVHLLFIVAAVTFSLAFGAWGLLSAGLGVDVRVMGVISVVIGLFLLGYGIYFFRKSGKIIV
jgi:hypothetical protein